MIVVTGGKGFIGKNLVKRLNEKGYIGVVVLDTRTDTIDSILSWLMGHAFDIDCIFHMGALTDTTIMNANLFDEYNVNFSVFIWQLCVSHKIPLIYASSAATYGDGKEGFNDEETILNLKPLNPYGWSKQEFDIYATTNDLQPPFWAGLKFFNVYGFDESLKNKMASVALQMYNHLKTHDDIKLFKSHHSDFKDGEQKRDFVYIDDVIDVCMFMYENKPVSGIYNVGTGKARTFNDLAKAVFKSLDREENIKYIDIPNKIRDKYQYFTEAKIQKLKNAGYKKSFHELEDGVFKYINILKNENC